MQTYQKKSYFISLETLSLDLSGGNEEADMRVVRLDRCVCIYICVCVDTDWHGGLGKNI